MIKDELRRMFHQLPVLPIYLYKNLKKNSGVKRRLRDNIFLGRFVPVTECYWHILYLKLVHSSFNVTNVQTTQTKNRVSIEMMQNVKEDVPRETVLCRFDLLQWRKFTSNQKLTIQNLPHNYKSDNSF